MASDGQPRRRIYKVVDSYGGERLVRASLKQHARDWVVRDLLKVEMATQDDLERLLPTTKVENYDTRIMKKLQAQLEQEESIKHFIPLETQGP